MSDKLGPINVNMGDGNSIDHIGHKIVFHAPPPPPNAIYQNGAVVGQFEGQPTLNGDTYTFPVLTFFKKLDPGKVTIQGFALEIIRSRGGKEVHIPGFGERHNYWDAECKIIQ